MPDPGLCATCRHATTVQGARSRFWRCRLAEVDPAFPRYPVLPVLSCSGYSAGSVVGAAARGAPR